MLRGLIEVDQATAQAAVAFGPLHTLIHWVLFVPAEYNPIRLGFTGLGMGASPSKNLAWHSVTESSLTRHNLRLGEVREVRIVSTTAVYFFLWVMILVLISSWSSPILNALGAKDIAL